MMTSRRKAARAAREAAEAEKRRNATMLRAQAQRDRDDRLSARDSMRVLPPETRAGR